MELWGDKLGAAALTRRVRVTVIPGSKGAITDEAEAIKIANKIGYPVIIKSVAGGGGRRGSVGRLSREDGQGTPRLVA